MAAPDLETLAAKLGRPAASLSAFRGLTADQVALLDEAIDATRARRRAATDTALRTMLPRATYTVVMALLRGRR